MENFAPTFVTRAVTPPPLIVYSSAPLPLMPKFVATMYVTKFPAGGFQEIRSPYAFVPLFAYDVNALGYWIVKETKGSPVIARTPPAGVPVYATSTSVMLQS